MSTCVNCGHLPHDHVLCQGQTEDGDWCACSAPTADNYVSPTDALVSAIDPDNNLGRIIVRLSDEDLYTCIVHAGASTYEWYLTFYPHDDEHTVYVRIGEDTDDSVAKLLTVDDLRRAIVHIMVDAPEYTANAREVEWGWSECDSDVDADIADVVLQVAVLGKVVYG